MTFTFAPAMTGFLMDAADTSFRNFTHSFLFSINYFQQVTEFISIDISQLLVNCCAYNNISKIIDGKYALKGTSKNYRAVRRDEF